MDTQKNNDNDEQKNEKKVYNVLSIDGGGVRGLFSAILISKILKALNVDCCSKVFDLVVGVSAGALNALSLAQNNFDLPELFCEKNLRQIFDKSLWDRIMPIQTQPKYDGKGKRKVIEENCKICKFGDMKTNVAILAYNLGNEDPRIFTSWEDKDLKTVDIADATSSPPIYFPCVQVENEWFADGGIVANSPSLIALNQAQSLFGEDADIHILSVGTGFDGSRGLNGNEAKNWGGPRWLYNGLIDIIMDAPLTYVDMFCKSMLKDNYMRLDATVSSVEIDNISEEYLKELTESANKLFDEKKDDILEFFSRK